MQSFRLPDNLYKPTIKIMSLRGSPDVFRRDDVAILIPNETSYVNGIASLPDTIQYPGSLAMTYLILYNY